MDGAGRLETFSDGVLAIVITIMVLKFQVPEGATLGALRPLVPVAASYVLSFVFIGIYRANLHLLFWLLLVPFVTGWTGEHAFAPVPTAV